MHNNSYLELDPKAYKTNIDFLRKHFHKGVLFSSVVKGNAYGHSIENFVEIALVENVKHFSVFDSQEARRVKEVVGDNATVMIMGWLSNEEDLNWIIENDIEFFVFEKQRLITAVNCAKKLGKKAIVHLEVETGMNRTGFNSSELKWVQDLFNKARRFYRFQRTLYAFCWRRKYCELFPHQETNHSL